MHKIARLALPTTLLSCAAGLVLWQSAAIASDPAPTLTHEESESRIFERQQLMEKLDEEAGVLGEIVAGLLPADKMAATTRSIANTVKESAESFKTPIPGGRSKPEVWGNHADFMQRMEVFVRETEEMAKLGEAGNLPAVTEKLGTALPCKQCHDVYRGPKKAQ